MLKDYYLYKELVFEKTDNELFLRVFAVTREISDFIIDTCDEKNKGNLESPVDFLEHLDIIRLAYNKL